MVLIKIGQFVVKKYILSVILRKFEDLLALAFEYQVGLVGHRGGLHILQNDGAIPRLGRVGARTVGVFDLKFLNRGGREKEADGDRQKSKADDEEGRQHRRRRQHRLPRRQFLLFERRIFRALGMLPRRVGVVVSHY